MAVLPQTVVSDWPQFLGPDRDGVYHGPALAESWGPGGPRVVWQKPVGAGFSGPVVAQGRVILFHRVADSEVVEALDARTGTSQWSYEYPTSYRDDFGFDEGPRAVPVVANGVVYTFGAEGQLHAVDLATGTRLWSEDTMRRYDVAKGFFGAGGSPLVEDGRVIANIGGKGAGIVAFDARTGKVLWTATDDEASYSSAVGATIGGRRYAVFLTRTGLVGLDPATGRVQFQRRWRARQAASVNAATPLVIGDLIFISAEYGPGAATLRYDGSSLTELWASDDALSNHYATSVHHDGILYGFHGRQEFGPELPRGRVAHRKGPMESGWVSSRQRHARRQSAGDSPRKRRARPGGRFAGCLSDPGARADPARDRPGVPGDRGRTPLRAERQDARVPRPAALNRRSRVEQENRRTGDQEYSCVFLLIS